ncbi:hypothetical protein BST81_18965 [Leptolyngbya sp. 'hensonii']|uniref:serine/threonine phosphatase n=1 Tax=Leptolyngbya sp. 'hensonii' TaxID=1922337 RepID=UPI00095018CF|nr:serine/threonine phosphatase [Leptolyngbya sp. 'hensonii']OLP16779.1 hypothetical protein BST81_18965 [Leptolyngbya sp. 'hensonii']
MLICPQCQFDNPEENRFCQECGTPLNLIICPECSARVEFEAEQCPNCGTVTGTYLWAIVSGGNGEKLTQGAAVANTTATYLDDLQRYKVVESLLPSNSTSSEAQARVLDCQPFQLSHLEIILNQGQVLNEAIAAPGDEIVTASPEATSSIPIPRIARPYLALHSQFHQTLPLIHDAWSKNGQEVLLLEDRTHFQPLLDLWSDEEVPPLQVLHWLHEMTELWAGFESWQCRQSLLELKNLRVDEDQVLCLQRLYREVGPPLSLKNLGQFWLELFSQTQRTQVGPLAVLLSEIQSGKLQTIEALQSRLYTISADLQESPVASAGMGAEVLVPESPDLPSLDGMNKMSGAETPQPLQFSGTMTEALDESSFNLYEPEVLSSLPIDDAVTADLGLEATGLGGEDEEEDEEEDEDEDSGEADDAPTVVLPMQLYSLEDAGRTDVGRQRDHNEDSFGVVTDLRKTEGPAGRVLQARGLYIMCDGMGGHAGGEVASALAVETIKQYFQENWLQASDEADPATSFPSQASIRKAVHLANKAIYDVNQSNARSGSGRMGTTLVLVLIQGTQVAVAHVGDSRLYCVSRRRGLEQLTTDHDVGQREIQRGVEPTIAYARPDAYQLTQALGPRDENFMNPDIRLLDVNEDTLLVLCSDGLTDNDLLEAHWRTHLEPLLSSQANLDRGVGQLIDLANEYNGHDNITAVLVRLKVRPNLDLMKQR